MLPNSINILFIGDVIGAYGRAIVKHLLPGLKQEFAVDLTIINGENAAHGYSLTEKIHNEFMEMGIDAVTMGNHTYEKKELVKNITAFDRMVRPANYPPGAPGNDHIVIDIKGTKVGIVNLLGRVYMQCVDCPFQAADRLIPKVREKAKIIIIDFHGEATSEKMAMGYYLDGKVSAVIGTHTHVMTADERVLAGGSAFISDTGMVGAQDSIIGMQKEQILKRFITQMPEKFEPTETGPGLFNAVLIKADPQTGKAIEIKRIQKTTPPLKIPKEEKNKKN